jgi:hypothetical protein
LVTMNCCGGDEGGCAVCSGAGGLGLTALVLVLADAFPARETASAPAANTTSSFERLIMRSTRASTIEYSFAELAVRFGLRKGVKDDLPEPDPSKKTTHWGKRKLKRDR